MNFPDEYSRDYLWWGLDSLVFRDPRSSQFVIKYYNHPNTWTNGRLFRKDIEEYHAIHQRYAKIWSLHGIAIYGWQERQFSVSVLDLWNDIHSLEGNEEIVITRVPRVRGNHCTTGNVLRAVENLLSGAGIPIQIPNTKQEGHFLSPRNMHYMEKEDGSLQLVITDLWASIRESLQIERRMQK